MLRYLTSALYGAVIGSALSMGLYGRDGWLPLMILAALGLLRHLQEINRS